MLTYSLILVFFLGQGAGGGGGWREGGNFQRDSAQGDSAPVPVGEVLHEAEGDIVVHSTNPKVPFFNAAIMLQNQQGIGKVDEIFGPVNDVYFSVKPAPGIRASSLTKGTILYIGSDRVLTSASPFSLSRFLTFIPPPLLC